jgi:hypothetical protein
MYLEDQEILSYLPEVVGDLYVRMALRMCAFSSNAYIRGQITYSDVNARDMTRLMNMATNKDPNVSLWYSTYRGAWFDTNNTY